MGFIPKNGEKPDKPEETPQGGDARKLPPRLGEMVWHYAYGKAVLAVDLGSTFDHAAYLAEFELKRRAKGSAHRGRSHALV